ncbi:hypothetical protein EDB85DRAFT_2278688 [Lactarius pseudohatsudake]|nr:hypothetical protein EDB85DRAFT_2278688 [Lactarius pseudohatsudake]
MHTRGRFTAVPPLNVAITASRLLPADPRRARTQQVLTNAPYSPPRRDPPLQELPQNVFSPQLCHGMQRRRESRQRYTVHNERHVWHISAAHADLAQRGESPSRVATVTVVGAMADRGRSCTETVRHGDVPLRTKGLSASAISLVPDLPIPDGNEKSAVPLVPGARTRV